MKKKLLYIMDLSITYLRYVIIHRHKSSIVLRELPVAVYMISNKELHNETFGFLQEPREF